MATFLRVRRTTSRFIPGSGTFSDERNKDERQHPPPWGQLRGALLSCCNWTAVVRSFCSRGHRQRNCRKSWKRSRMPRTEPSPPAWRGFSGGGRRRRGAGEAPAPPGAGTTDEARRAPGRRPPPWPCSRHGWDGDNPTAAG
jgi:hypothetical protein